MRLIGLELAGYRRFLSASIDLDSDPVAVIGRNEAGKSSLLDAMARLNDDEPVERRDQTRGHSFARNHRVITGWFALEEEDRRLLSDIPEANGAGVYLVTKAVDGSIRGGFRPYIRRDSTPRERARTLADRVATTRWYSESEVDDDQFGSALHSLSSTDETLSADDLSTLEALAESLPDEPGSSLPAQLKRRLASLMTHERASTPTAKAAGILLSRRPQFALFSQEHRELQSVYDLSAAADDPPPALRNLASLANLSLTDAFAAQQDQDYGRLERIVRDANQQLESFFSTAWRQSQMHVQIRIDQTELRILVDNLQGDLTDIAERSAGLQTFVALVAFLASRSYGAPPVVLIDEAETHLHYDAQADLIRVFSEQDAASKLVYTTHSAGCLPLDMGLGVRAVAALPNDTSQIENSIWEVGPGLSPMLLAMGASVLAFTRARRAVIGEGASEAILLPTLLREAVPAQEVNYQVAPGVANASGEAISDLEVEAVSVCYLLDGDAGGRGHARRLTNAGVPESRILFLGGSSTSGVALEDLIVRDFYARAVNEVFETWHPGSTYPASAVPAAGRASALSTWCRRRGFEAPDKKRVSARLLEMKRKDRSITMSSARGRTALTQAHTEIRRAFNAAASATGEQE